MGICFSNQNAGSGKKQYKVIYQQDDQKTNKRYDPVDKQPMKKVQSKDKLQMLQGKLRKFNYDLFSGLKSSGSDRKEDHFDQQSYSPNKKVKKEQKTELEDIPPYMKKELCSMIDQNQEEHQSMSSEDFQQERFCLERCQENQLKLVTDPKKYPFNGFGCVEVFGSDEKDICWHLRGTGTLISPKHVMTCSHIFVNSRKTVGKKYEFVFYIDGKVKKFKVKKVHNFQDLFVSKDAHRHEYDIALIELQKEVPSSHGYVGCDFSQGNHKVKGKIMVSGYPKKKIKLSTSEGDITEAKKTFVFHNCDTSKGVSGGSVIKHEEKEPYIIAIHILATTTFQPKKKAVMLNERILQIFLSWVEKNKIELNLNGEELTEADQQILENHCLTTDEIQLLIKNKLHQNVTDLKLNSNCINSKLLKVLFEKPQEWNLKVLHLSNNSLTDEGIECIICHESLKQLDLSFNQSLTCEGISQLSELTCIETLNLSYIKLGGTIFDALLFLKSLTSLNVRNCRIQPNENQTFLNPEEFKFNNYYENYKNLKIIDLSENMIGIKGISSLILLRNLQTIKLESCSIGNTGLAKLCQGEFPRIKEFSLTNNLLTSSQIHNLSKFYSLIRLDLGQNPLKNEGFKAICQFPYFLCSLGLNRTQIDDGCFQYLQKDFFEHMQVLDLGQNNIGEGGLYLLLNKRLDSIHELRLSQEYKGRQKIRKHILDKILKSRKLRDIIKDEQLINALRR